jgi:cytochrome c oxidase assembly protein subunit 15
VHALHRAGALLVCAVLLPLAWLAWRLGRRQSAALLVGLLVAQGALGAGLVLLGLPLEVALAHNVTAALLLAVLLGMTARSGA